MFSVLSSRRNPLKWVGFVFISLILAACEPVGFGGGPLINTSKPIPVALLVPGGSENANDALLASSLENAARLAMADLDGVSIDLRVYNTSGVPEIAANAAREAANAGAKIILGPVFAKNAAAVGIAVANRNINVLAFSNNTGVAGGNIFVLGPTFKNTADRLVRYSLQQGRSNIMIVNGQDGSEEIGRDAINRSILANGGSLAGITSFELSQQGVIDAVSRIASDVKDSGAQSIFLTSGTSGALPLLAQLLPENGVDPMVTQYIGLQRWDIPATAISLGGLQGGWFAVPDPALSANFQGRYTAAYGSTPHPVAGLAYDGIAAIGALALSGQADALSRTALTQPSGFVGVNGVFRLLADGTNERGLAVAQIQDNQVVVIDPAPRGFGGTGF